MGAYHPKHVYGKGSGWSAASNVLAQLESYYRKANVPMVDEPYVRKKILKLLNANIKLHRIPASRRKTPATQSKLDKMTAELAKTFCIWPKDAMDKIKTAEDVKFLQSMMTDRKASFGSHDKANAQVLQRKAVRNSKAATRRQRN